MRLTRRLEKLLPHTCCVDFPSFHRLRICGISQHGCIMTHPVTFRASVKCLETAPPATLCAPGTLCAAGVNRLGRSLYQPPLGRVPGLVALVPDPRLVLMSRGYPWEGAPLGGSILATLLLGRLQGDSRPRNPSRDDACSYSRDILSREPCALHLASLGGPSLETSRVHTREQALRRASA